MSKIISCVSEQGKIGILWTVFDGEPFCGRRIASFFDANEAREYLNLRSQLAAEKEAREKVEKEVRKLVTAKEKAEARVKELEAELKKAEKFISELAESLAKRWHNAKPPEKCDLSHYCLDVIAGIFLAKETAEARVKELDEEVETVKFKWDSEVCQICNYMRSPVAPCKCGQLAMTGTNDRLREQLKKAEEQIKRLNTLRS